MDPQSQPNEQKTTGFRGDRQHRYTRMQRLYVPHDLAQGFEIEADPQQSHYLANVLRLGQGAQLLLFNGRDGEWLARISTPVKKRVTLLPVTQTRTQPA